MAKHTVLLLFVFAVAIQVALSAICDDVKDAATLATKETSAIASIAKTVIDPEVAKIDAEIATATGTVKTCLEGVRTELLKLAVPSTAVKTAFTDCLKVGLTTDPIKTEILAVCKTACQGIFGCFIQIFLGIFGGVVSIFSRIIDAFFRSSGEKPEDVLKDHVDTLVIRCLVKVADGVKAELATFGLPAKITACKAAAAGTSTFCADVAVAPLQTASLAKLKADTTLKTDIDAAKTKVTTALADSSLSQAAKDCLNALTSSIDAIAAPSAAVKTALDKCIVDGLAAIKPDIDGVCPSGTDAAKENIRTTKLQPMLNDCVAKAVTTARGELTTLDVDAKIADCKTKT